MSECLKQTQQTCYFGCKQNSCNKMPLLVESLHFKSINRKSQPLDGMIALMIPMGGMFCMYTDWMAHHDDYPFVKIVTEALFSINPQYNHKLLRDIKCQSDGL